MLDNAHRRQAEILDELAKMCDNLFVWEPAAIDAAVAFFTGPYARHVADEEQSVLPALATLVPAGVARRLRDDHAWQAAAWQGLQRCIDSRGARGELTERLRGLILHHQQHTAYEDHNLLPILKTLDAAGRNAVFLQMRARRK